ncbi:hypothetical protein ACFW9N_19035 [Streptomyces sp. NPDC059496]|uniref:hypothetical protein n=1 Tax=Streptomyces sp. NPDC059496 TaxID=3346851 RepID=UPI0036834985
MTDGLSPEPNTYPPELLNAIGDLLATAHRHQVGVAFEPDGEGWRVHYLVKDWPAVQEYQLSAGPLSNAYDLQTAASAALRPLVKMGQSVTAYFDERQRVKDDHAKRSTQAEQ